MELNSLYIAIVGGVIFFVLLLWNIMLEWRLRKIFRGKSGVNLESILSSLGGELDKLNTSKAEIEKYLHAVERRLKKSVQKVNILRFNPFENSGSNQSFAVSFLDEKGDGVVISSLYSREGVRVYAKPILDYKSEYSLSEEEKEVIEAGKTS